MVDNKELETEALNCVKLKIQKNHYNYADLSCDKKGIDLLAYKYIADDGIKLIKVQSKGRNITKSTSNVKIYQHYVTSDFVCFIYLKTDDIDTDYLYLYLYDDIIKWNRIQGIDSEHDMYELYIGKNFVEENEQYRFDSIRAKKLDDLFEKQIAKSKPICFEHTSILCLFYDLWCEYGIRPDENALKIIDNDCDVISYNVRIGIFLACMLLVYEDKGNFYGIDWFVDYIKNYIFHNEIDESLVSKTGKSYSSNFRITYSAFVEEIEYGKDSDVDGFYLHIGDSEEKYDVYLLRDGRYGIIKKL